MTDQQHNSRVELPCKKPRASNLELLRVLLTLLVIAHHLYLHATLYNVAPLPAPTERNALFFFFAGSFGRAVNNCFVLVTGYFMCKSNITLRKFLKLYVVFVVCRLIELFALKAAHVENFGVTNLAAAFLPFYRLERNFFGCFFIFFATLPFLKKLTDALTEREHLTLIALTSYPFVVCQNLPIFSAEWGYYGWFVYLYFVASYLRLYPKRLLEDVRVTGVALLALLCAWGALVYIRAEATPAYWEKLTLPTSFVLESNHALAFATSLAAFLFFKNVRLPQSRVVNYLGSLTFGVLVLHRMAIVFLETRVWTEEDARKAFDAPYFPLTFVAVVLGVFAFCGVIEAIRAIAIDKPLFRFYDARFERKE